MSAAKCRFLLSAACAFLLCAIPATAQLENFLTEEPTAAKGKTQAEINAQLDTWQAEAKVQLDRLENVSSDSGLPPGITASDLSERKRYLEQILLGITRQKSNFDGIATSKEELAAMEAMRERWAGFETPPPYSILMVDELLNRKEAVAEKAASHQSSIDIFKSNLDILLAQWRSAGEAASNAFAGYQNAGPDNEAAQWRLEISQAKQRSISIRISALQNNIASLVNLKSAAEMEVGLLETQIRKAGTNTVFSEEDLQQINKASADRQASLRTELSEIRERQSEAESQRKIAAAALARAQSAEPPDQATVDLFSLRLQAADTRVESLQMMVELLESYGQLETFVPEAYEHRRTLVSGKSKSARKTALDNLIALNKRLEAWEIVAKNELASVVADINKQEAQAAILPAEDPKLVPLTAQRAALWEKQALIQRAYQSVTSQRRVLARWISDHQAKEKLPWYHPATSLFDRSQASVKRIWNVSVSEIKETTEVDGQTVEQIRVVSLGIILTALILFVTAYFIAAKISRRFQYLLVQRGIIGENQARTLRNWIMLVVALLLALATLSWLSIPLTIFAFLAGALAIGLGFGTQTIIKNFISGIILLFERKVRVGDIVEVDGTIGVVSEINTRSSIVRGFNGIENLIPNALFLENRVVNWTLNSRFLRKEISLGVSYGSPPQKIIDILLEAAERHGLILKDPAPFAVFNNFGESSLDFVMYYWIELNDKTNSLVVGSDLRIMIEKKLADSEIEVPFPQRDIRLASNNPVQIEIVQN